ncbi:hypothetical protein [Moraxella lacunata]|nr:hypothetical protein [Moraxella lacunata]
MLNCVIKGRHALDSLQTPELKKTVRGELCLPITVFRHPQA